MKASNPTLVPCSVVIILDCCAHFRLNLLTKVIELPPYPNKTQVRKILEIGDEKLSSWISRGLKVQHWSGQDIRIERSELQRFLKETFEI